MSATTETQPYLPMLTDADLSDFLAWQGSDAEALATVVSLDVEPAPEEDRDETPATDYPEDYGYEGPEYNPYIDDYDRWQDDLAADRYERTFRD